MTMNADKELKLRCLQDSELEKWYDFLTMVFSFKPTPRQLFVNHVETDPEMDVQGIFVLEYEDPSTKNTKFVSTLRIFHRHVPSLPTDILCGGLAEVATDPSWRGKGLASRLLDHSLTYMRTTTPSHDLSLLHSRSLAAQKLYARSGYVHLPSRTIKINCHLTRPIGEGIERTLDGKGINIRPINFEDEQQMMEISALYDVDSKRRRWPGPLRRDRSYWSQWVRPQVQPCTPTMSTFTICTMENNQVTAYLFAAISQCEGFSPTLLVTEYVSSPSSYTANLSLLICHVIQEYSMKKDRKCCEYMVIQSPRAVFVPIGKTQDTVINIEAIKSFAVVNAVEEIEENGLMAMVVNPFEVENKNNLLIRIENNMDLARLYENQQGYEPVFWPVDKF